MRILHTSDWHLGIQLHGVSLLAEQREMADRLIEAVRRERIDAVVIAGDVFDHAVARPEAISLYNDAMTALCQSCGVPVLLCAGNHDGAARLAACSALLSGAGLYIAGKLTADLRPVVIGGAAFFLLPWFCADEARYLYPEDSIRGFSGAMEAVLARLRERRVPGKRNLLVSHCFAAGAELCESDRAAMVGGGGQVGAPVFEGFDYVLLGHLHRPQNVAETIRYSGSPLPYSFSEAGQRKSFTLLDTETLQTELLPVETARTPRVLTGDYEQLLLSARDDPRPDDYLKIELADACAGPEKLEALRARYPNLLLLTGKPPALPGGAGSLTVDELSALSPRDLVTRFCEEAAGETPDEEQLGWFDQAARAVEEGTLQ